MNSGQRGARNFVTTGRNGNIMKITIITTNKRTKEQRRMRVNLKEKQNKLTRTTNMKAY
jgi:uncharacterized protein YebE (UPF0316 family)